MARDDSKKNDALLSTMTSSFILIARSMEKGGTTEEKVSIKRGQASVSFQRKSRVERRNKSDSSMILRNSWYH